MKTKILERKIEQETYNIIDELSEELNLPVPFYPEVYYINRKSKFETLGLPKRGWEDFELVKKYKNSLCSNRPPIILIGDKDIGHISEEAGHFLHFISSKLTFSQKDSKNLFALYSLTEMLGFFCSKLIDSNRKNIFNKYPDIINEKEKCMKKIEKSEYEPKEFFIYQQGYGLGERLFNAYISKEISRHKIQELFKQKFDTPNEAFFTFSKLKYKTLNHKFV